MSPESVGSSSRDGSTERNKSPISLVLVLPADDRRVRCPRRGCLRYPLAPTAPLLVSFEAASRGVLCLRPGAFEWVRSGREASQSEDKRFRVPWTLLLDRSGGARALPSPLEPASKSACWEAGGGLKAASDSAKVRSRWLLRGGGAGEREACLRMLGDESPLSGPLKPQSASESHPSPASSPGAASSNERRALKGPKTKPVGEGEDSTTMSPSADGLSRPRAGAKSLSSGDAKVRNRSLRRWELAGEIEACLRLRPRLRSFPPCTVPRSPTALSPLGGLSPGEAQSES